MSDKGRFLDTPSGVIQDTTSNIEWLPKDSYGDLGKWVTLQEGVNYAHLMKQVYAGGYSDWHLPSKEEVLQLYDETLTQKDWEDSDIKIASVFVDGCSCYLWTSEKNDEGQALRIDLRTGDMEFIDPMTRDHQAARLVRSGK
ncbi:MAG: DUF1566 domain-containing protein [Nitrospinae bacterium]|nr:DUF1566 domain-containing protein [Nitrospinota bacterium]